MTLAKVLAAFTSGCFVWLAADLLIGMWVNHSIDGGIVFTGSILMGASAMMWRISK